MYQETKNLSQVKKPVKKSVTKDLGLNNFCYPNAVQVSTKNLKLIIQSESLVKPE